MNHNCVRYEERNITEQPSILMVDGNFLADTDPLPTLVFVKLNQQQ